MATGEGLGDGSAGAEQLPTVARITQPKADLHVVSRNATLVDIAAAQQERLIEAGGGWVGGGLNDFEIGDFDANALGVGLIVAAQGFELAAGMIKEVAVEPLAGGEAVFIEVEAEPGKFLHQAVAVAGQTGLAVGGVEHEVETGQHVVAHGGMGKAMILGEQDAIFGDNERALAIAIRLHPLAEGAHAALEGLDVAMFGQGGGAGDRFAGKGVQPWWDPRPPATAFGQVEAMHGPDVNRHGDAVALAILGQHHAQIAQADGGGLHDGGCGDSAGGIALFEEGVDRMIEDGILSGGLLILTITIRFIADCPDTTGVGINLRPDRLCQRGGVGAAADHLMILHPTRMAGAKLAIVVMIPPGTEPRRIIVVDRYPAIACDVDAHALMGGGVAVTGIALRCDRGGQQRNRKRVHQ